MAERHGPEAFPNDSSQQPGATTAPDARVQPSSRVCWVSAARVVSRSINSRIIVVWRNLRGFRVVYVVIQFIQRSNARLQ